MHLLLSAAVPYTNYGSCSTFELPIQSGTYVTGSAKIAQA